MAYPRPLVLASVLLLAWSSAAWACSPCPAGYTAVPALGGCGFVCYTGLKVECLPQPRYDVRLRKTVVPAPTPLQYAAAAPRVCGGLLDAPCPAIACAGSSSYAFSGPNGCAMGANGVSAMAYSSYQSLSAEFLIEAVAAYISPDACSGAVDPTSIALTAASWAEAYAEAIASTCMELWSYTCTCCQGQSVALATAQAAVQAVAEAQAQAVAQAGAAIVNCDGNPVSISTATSQAFAQAVELAFDNQFIWSVSGPGQCGYDQKSRVKTAIARATACAFASVLASAVSNVNPGTTGACTHDVAVSGNAWSVSCPCEWHC